MNTFIRQKMTENNKHVKFVVVNCAIKVHKNSSGDEIANVNFYAVRPEATRIR